MFILGSFLTQYTTKPSWVGYQIDSNKKEDPMRSHPTSNSQNWACNEWISNDFYISSGIRTPPRLHEIRSELEVATSFHTYSSPLCRQENTTGLNATSGLRFHPKV